jgi:pyruvate/2-oxoglutarate/acetoin dehydrogenase E1 component
MQPQRLAYQDVTDMKIKAAVLNSMGVERPYTKSKPLAIDEAFYELDGPPVRITTPHIPLPAADVLEDLALPSADRIAERVRQSTPS